MAIHALWEDRYGLSVRKASIDLTDLTGTATTTASHDNTGAPTHKGKNHFTANTSGVIGQRTGASTQIYGIPVNGNPGIAINQETIEVDKTDGFATGRLSDIFRAGQNPSASFDFVVTGKSLISVASLFFQNGLKESSAASEIKRATLPSNTDGAEPTYYGTFLRKISSSNSTNHLLSDAVATSLSLSATQTDPLSASTTLQGRIMSADAGLSEYGETTTVATDPGASAVTTLVVAGDYSSVDTGTLQLTNDAGDAKSVTVTGSTYSSPNTTFTFASTTLGATAIGTSVLMSANSPSEAVMFGLDGTRNYLLQDSIITFQSSSNHVVLACESFDLNLSAEVTPNRFNTFFPVNMVTGSYTVDGSFTVPMLGKGATALDYDFFTQLLSDAGSSTSTTSTEFTGNLFTINWTGETKPATGSSYTPIDKATIASKSGDNNLSFQSNVMITDCTVGGDTEATMTVSFRGINEFTAGTDTIATNNDAFVMFYEDNQTDAFGYNTFS
tara:strand:- start:2884 stop:4386 length:1503 start_codon:yes stop_codon:yes gene_type:complete